MKKFFKNWFGNFDKKGKFHPSYKKFGLVLATKIAYILPIILLVMRIITGEQWLDFYKIIIPSTLALYFGGKWVDGKNNGDE